METPSVTTFKLSRHKKRTVSTTVISAPIGTALYAANGLQYGEGRFVFIAIGVFALLTTFFCFISYSFLTRKFQSHLSQKKGLTTFRPVTGSDFTKMLKVSQNNERGIVYQEEMT